MFQSAFTPLWNCSQQISVIQYRKLSSLSLSLSLSIYIYIYIYIFTIVTEIFQISHATWTYNEIDSAPIANVSCLQTCCDIQCFLGGEQRLKRELLRYQTYLLSESIAVPFVAVNSDRPININIWSSAYHAKQRGLSSAGRADDCRQSPRTKASCHVL